MGRICVPYDSVNNIFVVVVGAACACKIKQCRAPHYGPEFKSFFGNYLNVFSYKARLDKRNAEKINFL
jgi:hypothetical protein